MANTIDKANKMVRLIAVGWMKAHEASEIEVGDRIVYNWGESSPVTEVTKIGRWIKVTTLNKRDGRTYNRKYSETTLVAIIKAKKEGE